MIAESAKKSGQDPKNFDGKVAIVGGRGRMGRMLLEKAAEKGVTAVSVDRPYEESALRSALQDASLVILSVPAPSMGKVLEKIAPFMPPTAILSDIVSVKEMPMKKMEEAWSGAVIGTHPLFGPFPDSSKPLSVAMVPGKNASRQDYDRTAGFFELLGFQTFETTASEHDEAMARIQNMNFITNLAYFAVLANHKELLPFLTPSFDRRKNAARKMLTEDADMFSALFETNPHSHEAVRQFRKMLNIAASGDIDLLRKKADWWWKGETDLN